jgi:hypothetical protein
MWFGSGGATSNGWTTNQAPAYLTSVLRSTIRGLLDRLPRAPTLRDSRRQLLTALAQEYDNSGDIIARTTRLIRGRHASQERLMSSSSTAAHGATLDQEELVQCWSPRTETR